MASTWVQRCWEKLIFLEKGFIESDAKIRDPAAPRQSEGWGFRPWSMWGSVEAAALTLQELPNNPSLFSLANLIYVTVVCNQINSEQGTPLIAPIHHLLMSPFPGRL